jgi:Domain of unknown function DUF11
MSELIMSNHLRARHTLGAALVVAAAWLSLPVAAQAADNDLGVTQTLSATRAKPGGTINVTSTVTNLGTQSASEAYVELATLKGKILVFNANDTYSSISTSQGSCANNSEQGVTTEAMVCSLGPLAPGQSAKIQATIRVRESAVQTTTLLPKPGENEYKDAVKSNDAQNQPFYLDVPPKVRGSKLLKLSGLPKGCVRGDFNLTVVSKVAQTKKMKIKADLGFDSGNGRHLIFTKQANGGKIKMRVPASRADFQIDEGAFPSYLLIIKAKLGNGRVEMAKVEFKRC